MGNIFGETERNIRKIRNMVEMGEFADEERYPLDSFRYNTGFVSDLISELRESSKSSNLSAKNNVINIEDYKEKEMLIPNNTAEEILLTSKEAKTLIRIIEDEMGNIESGVFEKIEENTEPTNPLEDRLVVCCNIYEEIIGFTMNEENTEEDYELYLHPYELYYLLIILEIAIEVTRDINRDLSDVKILDKIRIDVGKLLEKYKKPIEKFKNDYNLEEKVEMLEQIWG